LKSVQKGPMHFAKAVLALDTAKSSKIRFFVG
jgi:hypothetical protein